MRYNPLMGLLGNQDSLAPNLGLMGRIANPDPIQDALAQMAAQRPQMAPGQAPLAQGPFAPPGQAPAPQAGPQAPAGPPPITPPPPKRKPLASPTQMALFTAGAELASQDAPTLAHAVSRALAAGVPAFVASKQANRDIEDANASERAFRDRVQGLVSRGILPPEAGVLAAGMGSIEGNKLLAKLVERGPVNVGAGEIAVNPTTRQIVARGRTPVQAVDDTLFGVTEGPGGPVATALTTPRPPVAEATTDIRDFVASYGKETLAPNDYQNWSPEAKAAFNEWAKARDAAKGTRVSTSVNMPPGVSPFVDKVGNDTGAAFAATSQSIVKTEDALAGLARAQQILQEPTFVGGLANAKTKASSIARAFGLDIAPDARINTQELNNLLKNTLTQRVKELGVNPSNADLQAMDQAIGSITNDPRTLERVFNLQREIIQKGQRRWNQDWLAASDLYRATGAQMPPNVRPVGADAQAWLLWGSMTAEERNRVIQQGGRPPRSEP